jgi:hypothetical protein
LRARLVDDLLLALSFVGFSALVVTLRDALGGELSDRHLRLVRLYIEGGFLVTALALVSRTSKPPSYP